ncbi:MAG TPA: hypothetical protein VK059_08945 [Nocardioidaceae bacterium]|nr:hypothetical protein [Nocardioidaceae bacterium]
MKPRGQGRILCTLVLVALAGMIAACDDSGPSPVEDPTPSVDGTPPSDRDSYQMAELNLDLPADAPPTAADRVLRIRDSYVLLGHDLKDQDGAIWVASNLTDWDARGGWIAGLAGVQRLVGLVEHDGNWVGAYNERPSGLPPLAWRLSTSDAGQNWQEKALPADTSQPSNVSGIISAADGIVAVGSIGEDEAGHPVAWRTPDGERWTRIDLPTDADGSVAPNEPFRIGGRILVPGAAVTYDGDQVTKSKPVLWSSKDGGKTFSQKPIPNVGDRAVPLFGLHADAVDLLFGWSGSDAVVWRSEDDGRSWQPLPESTLAHRPEGQSYPHRAVQMGDCLVLAGVIGDPTADAPLPAAMWRSCDAGKTWSRMATDELDDAGATNAVDLVRDRGSLVLVTNSADDASVRLLRLRQ